MDKNIMDQNEYESYKNEVTKWLDNANKIIDKHNNVNNIDDIHSNLNEIMVSKYFSIEANV
jgi:predicted  nucleic acid-binding Zn-ribbon protein